jgi:hypothetical protein
MICILLLFFRNVQNSQKLWFFHNELYQSEDTIFKAACPRNAAYSGAPPMRFLMKDNHCSLRLASRTEGLLLHLV